MKFIETLREGERINEIYLCKSKQAALTKSGKPYDNVLLQDKTGTLDAKIWDPLSQVMSQVFRETYSCRSSGCARSVRASMSRRIIFR